MAQSVGPVTAPVPVAARTAWYVTSPDLFAELRTGPQLDRAVSTAVAARLFPNNTLVPLADSTLAKASAPEPDHIYVGAFSGGTVVTCTELSNPLVLGTESWQPPGSAPLVMAFALDTASGTGGFARWESAELVRGFNAAPTAILDDQGLPYPFEGPFWGGEHPRVLPPGVAPDPFTLPFDAALFADRAVVEWLGFSYLDGDPDRPQPSSIPVCGFALRPPGYEPTAAELRQAANYSGGRVARWFGFAKPHET
ncbi:DUF6928 family protein [Jongsikchunia kroppenstedtii]|uniref:DUF6928 family protein n=1 Tax=Jongsikchunia kroppenstedtii TaxID=1121721 RepID=UPI00037300E1|nr:hypothetical protein [Jongsikchunia kroppenstedtii]